MGSEGPAWLGIGLTGARTEDVLQRCGDTTAELVMDIKRGTMNTLMTYEDEVALI